MNNKRCGELERRILSGDTEAIRRYTTEIRAYQRFDDPDVLGILLQALENSDGLGSRTVIQSLPEVPAIEPVLVRILESGYDYEDPLDGPVHVDAVWKLAALQSQTAFDAIRKWVVGALQSGERNSVYAAAGLRALAGAGDRNSLPLIRKCLHHNDSWIRSAAISAVQETLDREAVPSLLELLSDKSEDPRLPPVCICDTAATALGEIGDSRAVEPIAAMIEHRQTGPNPDGAIYALSRLGQPGLDALRDMLDRVEDELKGKIVYWL